MRKHIIAVLVVAATAAATVVGLSVSADSVTVTASQDAYDSPGGWPGYSETDVIYAGIINGPVYGGWRFEFSAPIPQGASIDTASATLYQSGWWNDDVPTVLAVDQSGTCAPFTAADTPADRVTGTGVSWDWDKSTPDSSHTTPSLVGPLQELVDSGEVSALCLIEAGQPGGGVHVWHSIESNASMAAQLSVAWSTGGGTGGTGGTTPTDTPIPSATAEPTATTEPTVTPEPTATAAPTATPTPSGDCTSVLFIGNSYIASGSPNMRDATAVEFSAVGRCLTYTYNHIGGANLGDHIGSAEPLIVSGLDYVVLQGMIGMTETEAEFRAAMDHLVPLIEDVGATPVVFGAWTWAAGALSPSSQTFRDARVSYALVAADYEAVLAPIGAAWAADNDPAYYDADGSHPAQPGTDRSAQVLFEVMN